MTAAQRIDTDDDEIDIGFDHRLLYAGDPYTGRQRSTWLVIW
ncbi:hypothetical protein [Streptomyces spinoverrucosus]|nr:hypothetical protein [Streptomyces spinoverrucosus]